MAKFILIKTKKTKKPLALIPIKASANTQSIKKSLAGLKKNFSASIITGAQLKTMVRKRISKASSRVRSQLLNKPKRKRRVVKRKKRTTKKRVKRRKK